MNEISGLFILAVIGLSFASPSDYRLVQVQNDDVPDLTINLYYETLCPDCQAFSKQQLCPVWRKLNAYFKIEFVPYGNARTTVNKTGEIIIKCQHGEPECIGNRIQACAIKHLSYSLSTKFICCMESSANFHTSAEICADKLQIDYNPILNCSRNAEGQNLHYLNGLKTDKLSPAHQYVPWILFNGQYNQADMEHAQEDLISVLCKYIDDPKPNECNEIF